jgi:uncharacterized protein YbaP (TraB family)
MIFPLSRWARGACAAACLAATAAIAQSPATPRLFLWEVVSMTNRVYLFGTVHAGKAAWYPLPAPVEAALADSNVLAVEADVTDLASMAKTAPAMAYKPPDTLEKHVSPADYERFRKLLPKYKLPEATVAQLKPFMAVSVLVFSEWARLGYLPQHGVDGYLIRKFKAENKPIVEVEGVDMQVKLMDSLTEAENRTLFDGTLRALEMEITSEQITGMVNAWQSGDPALMLEIARRYNEQIPGAKEFEEKFIWARHDDMTKKVEGYLASKERHFVAVGALHLAGPRGIVEMLKKRGYVVRQK